MLWANQFRTHEEKDILNVRERPHEKTIDFRNKPTPQKSGEPYFLWSIVVNKEQKGLNRAEYGKEVLKQLSAALIKEFGKGYSQDNLKLFRRFYVIYSQDQIRETVFTESKNLPVTLEWRCFYLSWGTILDWWESLILN